MASVIVTGGTGFIGGALLARLALDGRHRVFAPARVELDLLREDVALPRGFDVLMHCAASRDRGEDGPGRIASEAAINVLATARLYEAARTAGIAAIVHLSTISVLRPLDDVDALLDEESPQVEPPTRAYPLTKRWSEQLALQLRNAFAAVAVVRPGLVYGPEKRSIRHIAAQLRRGEPYRIARPNGDRYAPVHIDDVVDVLALILVSPSNLVVNVSGPDAISERQMVTDIARSLGRAVCFEETDDRVVSVVTRTARVDALFPDRVRTPWRDGV